MANNGELVLDALNALANRLCAIEREERARMISLFRENIQLDVESSHTLKNQYYTSFLYPP